MKRFFLDQFLIRHIHFNHQGHLALHCLGRHEESSFHFCLYLSWKEFNLLLASISEHRLRLKQMLSHTLLQDMIHSLRNTIQVDSCWLSIKIVELSERRPETDKEYCVENFGFIPA